MKFYRCCNPDCAAHPDFEADVPVCPDCKADGRLHSALLTELVPVHYLVKNPTGPIRTAVGNRSVACKPALARIPQAATGERFAVTCPACKASAVFKEHETGEVDQHVPFIESKIAKEHGLKGVEQGAG